MTILICDDLPEERLNLSQFLRNYERTHDMELDLEMAADGNQMLAMWKPGRWDLIFLDIYMPGLDGVEAARRLRKVDSRCEIVFATNSREHGMEGFELRVMDYVTKPFAQKEVDEVMDWFLQQRAEKQSELMIRTKDGEKSIRAQDIYYIESSAHNCIIHTKKELVSVRRSIETLAGELNSAFFRCHKSFLVSFAHVTKVENDAFQLDSGERVPISAVNRSKSKSAFLAWKTET